MFLIETKAAGAGIRIGRSAAVRVDERTAAAAVLNRAISLTPTP